MKTFHIYNFIRPYWSNISANNAYTMDQIIDLKTGVNYIFCHGAFCNHDWGSSLQGGYGWGYGYGFGGMSPRLDIDGKPIVSTKEEIKRACEDWCGNNGEYGVQYVFHLKDEEYTCCKR